MKRYACVAVVCLAVTLGVGTSSAHAQGAPATDTKMYVELNFGPTLGHKSDKFFGGEAGLKVMPMLDVFVEASHMSNVGTTDLDANATLIGNAIGATVSTAFKVNHGAIGARYHFTGTPMIHPYVLAAIGVAQVQTQVEFAIGGTTIDPASRGVQLGGDLTGTANKAILIFGGGVNVPFMERYFADIGYRYGQILARTSDVENDKSIPTQRFVLGVGVKF